MASWEVSGLPEFTGRFFDRRLSCSVRAGGGLEGFLYDYTTVV